jgi:hypothetical protein
MLLPLMGNKAKEGGSAVTHINEDGKVNAPSSHNMGLESACQDLINAIHSKDPKMAAEALKNALACVEE